MAMTFEEALKLGRERLPEADYFTEEEEAFIFSIKSNTDIGGMMSPIVVLKATGQCLPLPAYLGLDLPSGVLDEGFISAESNAARSTKGADFACEMDEDPNMGMNPKWIEKHLDEVSDEIRCRYEESKRTLQNERG